MPVLADARGWFTLEVPDGWDMKTEDSVTTLRSPHGGGVVYLSGARHVGGLQPSFGRADFLTRFLSSLGIDVEEEDAGRDAAAIDTIVGSVRLYHSRTH